MNLSQCVGMAGDTRHTEEGRRGASGSREESRRQYLGVGKIMVKMQIERIKCRQPVLYT